MDNDVFQIRRSMRDAIFVQLEKRNPLPNDDASKGKHLDAAKRLEEGLFKMAMTKEEYLNPSTLESRLTSLIKGRQLNKYKHQHADSSTLGTTITPTPGVSAEPTMQDNENRDQCETEIAENLKSVSLEP
ncbi:p300/CBP acetyltransferase-related protein-like protein [Arabidopsis thaliana]|uniref:P300/CBP acetyltransferase-related protein-like protein n=1 Tax=Arabidopsis thaliana TaxID=3702 RepID=F4I4I6_ARATH|nr:p300/CBP acetyltransferase-related protein-like protein [Arabidopsis thaliana]AEE29486.1 p300/CBP acetyltransferase-related protein-like protein [Arabidopsis thaliana]|eukprot:NP_001031059.1 p300/CBP acetyltransferase-related protein-like protein [Arabidopsis thaliana]